MCSIIGGTRLDHFALDIIHRSKDRGRDYFGLSMFGDMWVANHRATPTNEAEQVVHNQPFGASWKIVHNGTISNDHQLGNKPGEIDSMVLAKVLDFSNIFALKESLQKLVGSYAIAATNGKEIWLACNYKPIWWIKKNDQLYFASLKAHLGDNAIRVKPYSILNLTTGESVELDRVQPNRALVVCSAGLDSTTVLSYALQHHTEVEILHFQYGCRAESKEVDCIKKLADHYGVRLNFIDLNYRQFSAGSTLFGETEINTGKDGVEYALDWVPARNTVMLSLATAFAESNSLGYIYLGTNLEESGAYPDNEEQFILDFNSLLYGSVQNGVKVEIKTPLGGLMKREIVQMGAKYGTPYELTWSCYNNGDKHCGRCGPCYMRKLAFERAGIIDPTEYL